MIWHALSGMACRVWQIRSELNALFCPFSVILWCQCGMISGSDWQATVGEFDTQRRALWLAVMQGKECNDVRGIHAPLCVATRYGRFSRPLKTHFHSASQSGWDEDDDDDDNEDDGGDFIMTRINKIEFRILMMMISVWHGLGRVLFPPCTVNVYTVCSIKTWNT